MIATLLLAMAAMMIFERVKPARAFPHVRFWLLQSLAIIFVQIGVVMLGGYVWDSWFSAKSLFKLSALGTALATTISFGVISFVSYWQHRLKHRYDFLWRYFHQIHHAPSRIEILTSFYRSPLEILANMFLMSFILYGLLGAGETAGTLTILFMGAADLFYHWNIRTPVWVGYFIQRPEAHCVHHLSGVHAYNYGDIPLWDMLFGTYRNIATFNGTCGFGVEKEKQFAQMLLGHDLSEKRLRQ